jgi:uncharacterized RmlC-like cupin family protein
MIREEAVSSEGRWIGVVKAVPDMVSNWHHHGANDTYVYVIQGGLRIEYGPEGKEHAELVRATSFIFPETPCTERPAEGQKVRSRLSSGSAAARCSSTLTARRDRL